VRIQPILTLRADRPVRGRQSAARRGEEQPPSGPTRAHLEALLHRGRRLASQLIREALDAGVLVKNISLQVFQRSQSEIGRVWQLNQVGLAQAHYRMAAASGHNEENNVP
jgi:hypothetical protein